MPGRLCSRLDAEFLATMHSEWYPFPVCNPRLDVFPRTLPVLNQQCVVLAAGSAFGRWISTLFSLPLKHDISNFPRSLHGTQTFKCPTDRANSGPGQALVNAHGSLLNAEKGRALGLTARINCEQQQRRSDAMTGGGKRGKKKKKRKKHDSFSFQKSLPSFPRHHPRGGTCYFYWVNRRALMERNYKTRQ